MVSSAKYFSTNKDIVKFQKFLKAITKGQNCTHQPYAHQLIAVLTNYQPMLFVHFTHILLKLRSLVWHKTELWQVAWSVLLWDEITKFSCGKHNNAVQAQPASQYGFYRPHVLAAYPNRLDNKVSDITPTSIPRINHPVGA